MTGLHPVEQLARGIHAGRRSFAYTAWHARYAARKLARATDQERLEMDRLRIVKEQRRLEKQLRKQGAAPLSTPRCRRRGRRTVVRSRCPARAGRVCRSAPAQNHGQLRAQPRRARSRPRKKPSLAELLTRRGKGGAAANDPATALGDRWLPRTATSASPTTNCPTMELLDTADTQGQLPANQSRTRTRAGPRSSIRSNSSASASAQGRHHQGADHHPLRGLSRQGRARGQDRQPGARPRPRHPRRAHQHPRPHPRQGHRRASRSPTARRSR